LPVAVDRNADSLDSNPFSPWMICALAASSPFASAAEYATSRSMWSAHSCSKLCPAAGENSVPTAPARAVVLALTASAAALKSGASVAPDRSAPTTS